MVYRKGERTARVKERQFEFAVDVPIPSTGLGGAGIEMITLAVSDCKGEADEWSHSAFPAPGAAKAFYVRIGFELEEDADQVAEDLMTLGARRVR